MSKWDEGQPRQENRDSDLGDTLDFSQTAVQQSMQVGRAKAEQVLGK